MRLYGISCLVVVLLSWGSPLAADSFPRTIDIERLAIDIEGTGSLPDAAGARLFLERELAARTGQPWTWATAGPIGTRLVVGTVAGGASMSLPEGLAAPRAPEAYALWTAPQSGEELRIHLLGYDARGLLFAAGRLLRALSYDGEGIQMDRALAESSAPASRLRGHQLGYRNTANSYDAWDVDRYDQYIRDLIAFGTNAVELIPSLDPAEKESVHMDLTMWDMTVRLSGLLGEYGLETWMWLPLDGDVGDDATARDELAVRRKLFEACPGIDGVFVPGGDPGHTHPDLLMPWLGRMASVLRESHPAAKVWVSNQGFTPDENDAFFQYIEKERPPWLGGVVFGPWVKLSLDEMRAMTPGEYPIRRYPDIAHCVRCQYPVPRWDRAFAHTLGREPYNPRPEAIRTIHNLYVDQSAGAITYSDGVNDDVNKFVWSALAWNPKADVREILTDYSRYFLTGAHAEKAAAGVQAFEDAWVGPLAGHAAIEKNLARWEAIADAEPEARAGNWRFQLALLRARYDAYVQRRLAFESSLEDEALAVLDSATADKSGAAIAEARAILSRADDQPEGLRALREQLVALGHDLWKSIGMQLDVKNYQARNAERGAILEFLETPLNDRLWLESELDRIVAMKDAQARRQALQALVHWEDPGPGSFYDDLGHAGKQPHLVVQRPWEVDPSRVHSPQEEYSKGSGPRLSWLDQAQTLYGTPLKMRYTNLDPGATYELKVTYAGRFRATVRLIANGTTTIHEAMPQPDPIAPVTFPLDPALTRDGTLDLSWELLDGRGVQVAEVWLLKVPEGADARRNAG